MIHQPKQLIHSCLYVLMTFIGAFFTSAGMAANSAPSSFVVAAPGEPPSMTTIVVQWEKGDNSTDAWERLRAELEKDRSNHLERAVRYLQEGIEKMTGRSIPIVAGPDLSRGIVLSKLAATPDEVKNDADVREALRSTGENAYNAREAFFIRTEPERILVVANTNHGLYAAVGALLESVDYEVLGMGPNWTHVPDYRSRPLVFSLQKADRPSFYLRMLVPTSGQQYGVGTIARKFKDTLSDPADELVEDSYDRWRFGTRMMGSSMPPFPGHALQHYHKQVVDHIRTNNLTDGFKVPKITVGALSDRPSPSAANDGELWIDVDPTGVPYISNGVEWKKQRPTELQASVDLSVPWVREIVFKAMQDRAEKSFQVQPDAIFVFPTDIEDGGSSSMLKSPNWYPEYLASEGVRFGQPYSLHGFKGLEQPVEIWDPASITDTTFAFSNWLLREFDKWIDSLPEEARVTSTGDSKKELVRCSLYSYNNHDVPPNFNLDQRIRVMIASYPKNRGSGKWVNFKTSHDIAAAFQKMLPREPSGDYNIMSIAYHRDHATTGIGGSPSPEKIRNTLLAKYECGYRALNVEIDFNFGKLGLAYYLYPKMLWNIHYSAKELEALKDRWLQRAFGNGWQEMKGYYDFMSQEKFTVNAPNNWAKAIRMIDAADKQINPAQEPAAKLRIDDVKQYWYFYYLLETGQATPASEPFKELIWKGQMSYMNAMQMLTRRFFQKSRAAEIAGEKYASGPAHFTPEETQEWWTKILGHWQVTPVDSFFEAVLADGTKGADVDLNDLVQVSNFQGPEYVVQPFSYHSNFQNTVDFLTAASKPGVEIGFKLWWGSDPKRRGFRDRDVSYGISVWNSETKEWDELVDSGTTYSHSKTVQLPNELAYELVNVQYKVPKAGTYRVEIGRGGQSAKLAPVHYDPVTDTSSEVRAHTYFSSLAGRTQSPTYIYIPKGTKSLDLEMWEKGGGKTVVLHNGLPSDGLIRTRTVDVSTVGTHRIALEPGEDGSIARLDANGFGFPYLYSVPMLWAKSPAELLVPRAVAKADDLTIAQDSNP